MDVKPILNDNFKSLMWDRNEFMTRLSQDAELAKCLLCNDSDFKKYSLSPQDIESLPFKNIYPCLYTFGTTQEVKSMITMGFEYIKGKASNVWKVGTVSFYCFCHKEIVRTFYGLRYDFMLQRINDLIFDTRNSTWLGKMEFVGMRDIIMEGNSNYVGVMVKYKNTELM